MGWFGSKKHNPDEAAFIEDITGTCGHCRRHTTARRVAYYSGEIVVRCNNCKKTNKFEQDGSNHTNASRFAPFITDEDDQEEDKKE